MVKEEGRNSSSFLESEHPPAVPFLIRFFSYQFSCQDALEKAYLVVERSHLHVSKVPYRKVK